MIRTAGVLLLSVSLCATAHAQLGQIPAWPPLQPAPASSSYVGPGNIASGAIAFYSAGRAYNAAYASAASPLADLVDTSTGALTCTMKVATTGYADLSSVVCPTSSPTMNVSAWCSSVGGCSVTKIYDQTGNGNHAIQGTLASMPPLTFGAQNGLPCLAGNGSATPNLTTSGNVSATAPFTMTFVGERTGNFTTNQRPLQNGVGINFLGFANSANTMQASSGTIVALTAADSAFHAALAVSSSTAPLFAIDSSSNTTTSSNGTTAMSSVLHVMGRGSAGLSAGYACEEGVWPSDQNANYIALLANMRSSTYGWNF